MSTVVMPASNLSSFSYIFVMGGDTYDGSNDQRNLDPGLADVAWENGYKNDGIVSYYCKSELIDHIVRCSLEHNWNAMVCERRH